MVAEQDMLIENLAQYLGTIEDPRCSGKVGHHLLDILVVAVCAWASPGSVALKLRVSH